MLRSKDSATGLHRLRYGFHLMPFAVLAGAPPAPVDDDRMQGAKSALNRVQVWLGDLWIDLAAWRRRRVRGTGVGQTDRQTYFNSM